MNSHQTDPSLPDDEYLSALGLFIHQFAKIEFMLQLVLWSYARVDIQTARAIFSGVRIAVAKNYINRITEVHHPGDAVKAELDDVLTQLGHINQARNDIIHFGAEFQDDNIERIVSNRHLALTPSRIRERAVSAPLLDDLTADLVKIEHILRAHITIRDGAASSQNPHILRHMRETAWRYKPQQPSRGQKSNP